jgi:hypothetical protein
MQEQKGNTQEGYIAFLKQQTELILEPNKLTNHSNNDSYQEDTK